MRYTIMSGTGVNKVKGTKELGYLEWTNGAGDHIIRFVIRSNIQNTAARERFEDICNTIAQKVLQYGYTFNFEKGKVKLKLDPPLRP